jgi:hypothetical protein
MPDSSTVRPCTRGRMQSSRNMPTYAGDGPRNAWRPIYHVSTTSTKPVGPPMLHVAHAADAAGAMLIGLVDGFRRGWARAGDRLGNEDDRLAAIV